MRQGTVPSSMSRTIDFARAIAVLLVISTHTSQQIRETDNYSPSVFIDYVLSIGNLGAAGVPLFFVISGFLMQWLHEKNFSMKTYWKKRFARIYPLWVFWTLVAILSAIFPITAFGVEPIYLFGHGIIPNNFHNIVLIFLQLLFLGWLVPSIWNSFVPGGWSIQSEMGNYLLFAFLKKIKLEIIFSSIVLVTLLYILVIDEKIPASFTPIAQAAVTSPYWFFSGVLLSKLMSKTSKLGMKNKFVLGTFIFATCCTVFTDGPFISQAGSLVVILIALVLSFILARKIEGQTLVTIGKYSYGIYFAHFIFILPITRINDFVASFTPNSIKDLTTLVVLIFSYIFVLLGSLALAKITYRYIEKPFLIKYQASKHNIG